MKRAYGWLDVLAEEGLDKLSGEKPWMRRRVIDGAMPQAVCLFVRSAGGSGDRTRLDGGLREWDL